MKRRPLFKQCRHLLGGSSRPKNFRCISTSRHPAPTGVFLVRVKPAAGWRCKNIRRCAAVPTAELERRCGNCVVGCSSPLLMLVSPLLVGAGMGMVQSRMRLFTMMKSGGGFGLAQREKVSPGPAGGRRQDAQTSKANLPSVANSCSRSMGFPLQGKLPRVVEQNRGSINTKSIHHPGENGL